MENLGWGKRRAELPLIRIHLLLSRKEIPSFDFSRFISVGVISPSAITLKVHFEVISNRQEDHPHELVGEKEEPHSPLTSASSFLLEWLYFFLLSPVIDGCCSDFGYHFQLLW